MNVLISLHTGYGLGDAVMMSSVLKHIKKAYPNWTIYYQADPGHECVGNGIVHQTFAYGQMPEMNYHCELQICLYNKWYGFTDRPNTHVTQALKECFNMPWDKECGRYEVNVSAKATREALSYMTHVGQFTTRFVGIQTKGRTAKDKKDLTPEQGEKICDIIRGTGRTPFYFENYSGNAEGVCALIRQCEAFIGIDSGPSKCASATDTPTLVVWTGHHPAQFHDPADNTTHLVPVGVHHLEPVNNDQDVVDWFHDNYKLQVYNRDPVTEIESWLRKVLK